MDLPECAVKPVEHLSDSDSKCTKENLSTITESTIEVNVDPRAARNVTERKRKEKIKMFVGQLKEMVPADFLPALKRPMSHNVILETVVTYLKHLKEQNDLLLQSQGSEVQCEEIKRLKRELITVTKERDTYEKMVKSSAVHTSSLIPQLAATSSVVSSVSPPQQVSAPITTSAGQRLPGQGLIITQNGQAYYVNEQGMLIAQGVATPQLLADSLMSKSVTASAQPTPTATTITTSSNSTATSLVTSTTTCTAASSTADAITTAATTCTPNQPTATAAPQMVTTAPATTSAGVCNGLVAVPGHNGQLPSAIILPNGQVIPVMNSSGVATTANCSSFSTSTFNSTLTSTASSSAEVTSTTTSLSSGVMLLGQQSGINNIVLSTNQPPASDCPNQLGRKIMPKPQLLTPLPRNVNMMSSVSLTPLPVPTCSVAAAPDIALPGKKKRTRKKKVKGSDERSSDDILAAATASLFSPQKSAAESAGDVNTPLKETIVSETLSTLVPPSSSATAISTDTTSNNAALPVVSTNRKPQKRKTAKSIAADKSNSSSKKSKANAEKAQAVGATDGGVLGPPMDTPTNCQPAVVGEKPAASDAIEFDPNELDMVLDQVESKISSDCQLKTAEQKVSSDKDTSNYQVLEEGADIGHIFSTSGEIKPYKPGSVSPVSDVQSQSDNKGISTEASQSSYSISESYLIGNLTKTAEPVDHRWLGESTVTVTKRSEVPDVSKMYPKPWSVPSSESKSASQTSSPSTQSLVTTSSPDTALKSSTDTISDVNQYFGKYFHQRSAIFNGEEMADKSTVSNKPKPNTSVDTASSSLNHSHKSDSTTSHRASPPSSNSTTSKSPPTKPTFSPFYSPVPQEPENTNSQQPQVENRHASTTSSVTSFAKLNSTHQQPMRAEPKWSPARESEQNKINDVISTPYSSVTPTQPSPICSENQWQNKNSTASYHYRGLSSQPLASESQNRPSSAKQNPTGMQSPHNNPMSWSSQSIYSPYQTQPPHQPPHQQQSPAAPVGLPETNTPSQHTNAFSSVSPRNLREQQSLHNLDHSRPLHHERTPTCSQITPNPKSHAFSTESLLNKPTERRNQPIHPTPGRSFPPAASVNTATPYNKPYVPNSSNNVPFNVNLFTSQPSAFKRQGNFHGGSYIPNAEQSVPFTFSLTKTSDSSLTSSFTPNQRSMPLYSKSSQQQPAFPTAVQHQQQQQPSPSPTINFHSSLSQSDQLKSSRDFRQTDQPLFQETNLRSEHLTSSTEPPKKSKKPRFKPVVSQSPALLSKTPTGQQSVTGSFHQMTNDFTSSSDIFNAQKITSQINPPFNLPFQPPGFGSVQPHASSSLPNHSANLPTGHRFNINSFFKDSAVDPFRFPNPAHSSSMYSPAPSFYPNPMGIGNILGGGHTGIDANRPAPLATHPGFHSFHPSLDFQLTDQPNGA